MPSGYMMRSAKQPLRDQRSWHCVVCEAGAARSRSMGWHPLMRTNHQGYYPHRKSEIVKHCVEEDTSVEQVLQDSWACPIKWDNILE